MSWLDRLLRRDVLPEGFGGRLSADERVLALAEIAVSGDDDPGGHLVATSHGVWVPAGPDRSRRVGWHLVTKVNWTGSALVVIEAEEIEWAGDAVLVTDRPTRRFVLPDPGTLPAVVRERVEGSIRSRHRRDLPGGGAWFVQRKVPGRDGIVLQVRADPGVDDNLVRSIAFEVAQRLRAQRPPRRR